MHSMRVASCNSVKLIITPQKPFKVITTLTIEVYVIGLRLRRSAESSGWAPTGSFQRGGLMSGVLEPCLIGWHATVN